MPSPCQPVGRAADATSSERENYDGAMQGTDAVPEVEKLSTPTVEHTRGHISRLRGMVREQTNLRLRACLYVLTQPGHPA